MSTDWGEHYRKGTQRQPTNTKTAMDNYGTKGTLRLYKSAEDYKVEEIEDGMEGIVLLCLISCMIFAITLLTVVAIWVLA